MKKFLTSPETVWVGIVVLIVVVITIWDLSLRDNAVEHLTFSGIAVTDTEWAPFYGAFNCPRYSTAFSYTGVRENKPVTGTVCCRQLSAYCATSRW